MSTDRAPRIPAGGGIPTAPVDMPSSITYNALERRLILGKGYIDNVTPEMAAYEVHGRQVLRQWFSYRNANRSRPIIGDRSPPSPLGEIHPAGWIADYTTDLLDLLHVLGRLVDLEPRQASQLKRVCEGHTIAGALIDSAAASAHGFGRNRRKVHRDQMRLPG